jgi:hypothetical protein
MGYPRCGPFSISPVTAGHRRIDLSTFTEDTKLTDTQLRNVLTNAGFRGYALNTAFAVARAESSGRPYAYNGRGADRSYGILQINMKGFIGKARKEHFGLSSYDDLFQPEINAKSAYEISNGGKNWKSWGAYTNGSYRKYL